MNYYVGQLPYYRKSIKPLSSTGMAGSILVVLPSIDPTFSQGFCVRDLYVFDSSYLNSGVVPSISSSFQSRQKLCIICEDWWR